jgi:integrase
MARGSVIKRGKTWSVRIDAGTAPGRVCENPNKHDRHTTWTTLEDEDATCGQCGSSLGPVVLYRQRKWHPGYPTKKAAQDAQTELLGNLAKGDYTPPNRLTVREFATDQWLPSIEALVAGDNMRPSTAAGYRTQIEAHIVPRLGSVLLRDITAPTLNKLYSELLTSGRRHPGKDGPKGLSPTSVHMVHVTLHRMLKDAVRWQLVPRNMADLADAPRPKKSGEATMAVWSPEQLRAFLKSVENDRLYALWLTLATTGLRRGEIAGLQWSDVDLDAARLRVSRARVVVNHKVIDSDPKTGRSRREMGLDSATVGVLRTHRRRQAEQRLAWGPAYQSTDLVFTWEDGRPLHPNLISKTFARLAGNAKLPVIRLHDLRHSYASAALEAGIGLKVVSERLGHASISVTGDIYSHVRAEVDQQAADQVAGLILGDAG